MFDGAVPREVFRAAASGVTFGALRKQEGKRRGNADGDPLPSGAALKADTYLPFFERGRCPVRYESQRSNYSDHVCSLIQDILLAANVVSASAL